MNYKLLANDISAWIENYALENNIDSLIVGVSGGVDSSVVSTLCARTGIKTYAYGLPVQSHPENSLNSEIQLEFLRNGKYNNVTTNVIDLSRNYKTFDYYCTNDLTRANTKSRVRMIFLYIAAGNHNGIVVGTGNLVEDQGVGFFTKYGDGGVDISPIGELTKTQVRELAKYLGIPQEIIDAPPTDGLWDDPEHNDEKQIGATYEELETAMLMDEYSNLNHVFSQGEFESTEQFERRKEVYKIYKQFHNKNAHKMQMPPIFQVDKERYK